MICAHVSYKNSRCVVKLCRNAYKTNGVKTADSNVIYESLRHTKQLEEVSGSNFVKNFKNKKYPVYKIFQLFLQYLERIT